MSQAADEPTPSDVPRSAGQDRPRTGHDDVDAALADLDGLEHRPLDEQAPALERAHETLRAVLAGAGDATAGSA
jgi:hypothetical protein